MTGNTKDLLLLLDLDGTLWDASEQLAQSWNCVLQSLELKCEPPHLTAESLLTVLGRTMDEIANALLPGLDEEERKTVFRKCEAFENIYIAGHGGTLYPGVEKTLAVLQEQGYKMAVVSNCQMGYIDAFYTYTGLGNFFFDKEEWGHTGKSKAENIRLVMERNGFEKAVYIGDIIGDYNASVEAGIPFIHAAYGFGEVPQAAYKISRFDELPNLLNQWFF